MKRSIPILCLGGACLAALGFWVQAAMGGASRAADGRAAENQVYVYVAGPAPVLGAAREFGWDPADPFFSAFDPAFANRQGEEYLLRRMQRALAALDRQAALLEVNPMLDASTGMTLSGVCIKTRETLWTPQGAQTVTRIHGDCAVSPQDRPAERPAPAPNPVELHNTI